MRVMKKSKETSEFVTIADKKPRVIHSQRKNDKNVERIKSSTEQFEKKVLEENSAKREHVAETSKKTKEDSFIDKVKLFPLDS